MARLIDAVEYPRDIRRLTLQELDQLATEIREEVISVVSEVGGHGVDKSLFIVAQYVDRALEAVDAGRRGNYPFVKIGAALPLEDILHGRLARLIHRQLPFTSHFRGAILGKLAVESPHGNVEHARSIDGARLLVGR